MAAVCTLYTVKRFTAAQARQNFASLLDAAESGEKVIVERGSVRFAVKAERRKAIRPKRRIIILDPAVEAGEWTWALGKKGLEFRPRRRRK